MIQNVLTFLTRHMRKIAKKTGTNRLLEFILFLPFQYLIL